MARKRRSRTVSKQDNLYRLEGEGVDPIEKRAPGDGVALSWAVNVVIYRERDNRPGTELPPGDYTLFFVGEQFAEPLYILSKPGVDDSVVSWVAA